MECSLGLMIRDRQTCYLYRTSLSHAALTQSLVLFRGEVDQLQEVVNTNEAHLGDSYSFSQILLGRPSWPHQIHYFSNAINGSTSGWTSGGSQRAAPE
jgi:hypothetical protein